MNRREKIQALPKYWGKAFFPLKSLEVLTINDLVVVVMVDVGSMNLQI